MVLEPTLPLDRFVLHQDMGGGTCERVQSACVEYRAFDRIAERIVSPEKFVRADLVVERRTDRVGVQVLVSEDGAREVRSAHNLETDSACSGDHCLPANVAWSEVIPWRSDPECAHSVAHGTSLECPRAEIIIRYEGHVGTCEQGPTLFEPGTLVPGTTIYEPMSAGCEAVTYHYDDAFYEIGKEIPISRFAPLEQRTTGAGSLRIRFGTAPPSTDPLDIGTLVDRDDQQVTMYRLDDNRLHAVGDPVYSLPTEPSRTPGSSSTFADPECRELAVIVGENSCTKEIPRVLASTTDACGKLTTLHRVEPIDTAYQYTETGCAPMSLDKGVHPFAVGGPVSPDTYPVMREITEE